MEKLRLTTREMDLKVEGDADLIKQEREAFFSYLAERDQKSAASMERFAKEMTRQNPSERKEQSKNIHDIHENLVYKRTENHYTNWQAIKDAIDAGMHDFRVGDVVEETLKNGECVELVVVDTGEDYVRFESRDCVGGKNIAWDENDNTGGFSRSDVKKYLNNTIWELLPDALKSVILETERKRKNGDEVETYAARLFLPAASEVFEDEDNCYGDEGVYEPLEYYKDRRNRMKGEGKGKDTCHWWLASADSGGSYSACYVSDYGYANGDNVNSPCCGVPLCFCIQKS